jgi:hypothetical protein
MATPRGEITSRLPYHTHTLPKCYDILFLEALITFYLSPPFFRSTIRSDVGNGNPQGETGFLGLSLIRYGDSAVIYRVYGALGLSHMKDENYHLNSLMNLIRVCVTFEVPSSPSLSSICSSRSVPIHKSFCSQFPVP